MAIAGPGVRAGIGSLPVVCFVTASLRVGVSVRTDRSRVVDDRVEYKLYREK